MEEEAKLRSGRYPAPAELAQERALGAPAQVVMATQLRCAALK